MTKEEIQAEVQEAIMLALRRAANGKGIIRLRFQPWWITVIIFSVGVLSSWTVFSFSAKSYVEREFQSVSAGIQDLQRGQEILKKYQFDAASDRWSGSQMRVYNNELRLLNPAINTPDVNRIRQEFPARNPE